ncbi:MAG: gliding motility lipoprotein GldH [Chlorobi bacterium]|nr:gliding motility lipoprotein GldH [Chlorobiota bacterium]
MGFRYFFLFLFMFTTGLFLSSCDSNRYYEKNIPFDDHIWASNKPLAFSVDIDDTLNAFNFLINIRHNTDYRYSNIFLFLDTQYPDGNHSHDTLECLLAAPDGKWFGKGNGKIKENRILLKRNVFFPRKGTYEFKFEQAMRTDELGGMEDFGIRIEKFAD